MFFRQGASSIRDCGDYLAIHTPGNPTYHWGNFLLFRNPPGEGAFADWNEAFKAEFQDRPEVRHKAFGWDAPDGETGQVEPFLQAGYELDLSVVLTASSVQLPPQFNEQVLVRILNTDTDWEAATQNQIRCGSGEFSTAGYAIFKQRQMAAYRKMVGSGLGQWFGAFVDGELAGELGVFVEDGLGRFQVVGTAPEFRRQGVCRSLVYAASQYAFASMGVKVLTIVAEQGAPVARTYAAVGFQPSELQIGVSWWSGLEGSQAR